MEMKRKILSQTSGDRTLLGGLLHQANLLGIEARRQMNINIEARNSPGLPRTHGFAHQGVGTAKIPTPATGMNSHHGEDASANGTGQQISWGKAIAVALMIRRGIGCDDGGRGEMLGSAVEITGVEALNQCHKTSNQWIEIGSASPALGFIRSSIHRKSCVPY